MDEIKKLYEELKTAFAAMRDANDRGLKETADNANAKITALEKQIRELETKAARPGAAATDEKDAEAAEYRKAYLGYIRKGRNEDVLLQKTAQAGVPADGGYAIPEELDRQIGQIERTAVTLRQVANVITTSAETFEKLFNLGGAASGWVGETAARPATNTPQLASVKPLYGELYANAPATQKILDDAMFNVEAWLADEIAQNFAAGENTAFMSGDGVDKPKGILAYTLAANPTFGQILQTKSGVAGTIVADKLIDVVFSVKPGYRKNWLMASSTLAAIRKLKDGQNNYLFQPSFQAGMPGQLLGYAVLEDDSVPVIAAGSNSILFGDFKRAYTIADVRGVRMLRDPYTNKPHVNFYATKRVGGGLMDSTAISVHTLAV